MKIKPTFFRVPFAFPTALEIFRQRDQQLLMLTNRASKNKSLGLTCKFLILSIQSQT